MIEQQRYIPPERSDLPNFNVERIKLAGNMGTCGGVEMSLEAVDQVMDAVPDSETVWTNNAPVNFPLAFAKYGNRLRVIERDERGRAVLSSIPDGSVFIVSAHGAPPMTFEEAREKNLLIIDTTCALVASEQKKVRDAHSAGFHTVFIGKPDHPETVGVRDQVPEGSIIIIDPKLDTFDTTIPDNSKVFAKTTNEHAVNERVIEKLRVINPTIDASDAHSCYALRNRFASAYQAIEGADFWLMVGDESSDNAKGLRDIGPKRNIPSALITGPEEIDWNWFTKDVRIVGVSAAASVPEKFTHRILLPFRYLHVKIERLPQAIQENYRMFRLPNDQIEALRQRYAQ